MLLDVYLSNSISIFFSHSTRQQQKTRVARVDELTLHSSINSVSNQKMEEMVDCDRRISRIIREEGNTQLFTDHLNGIHNVNANVDMQHDQDDIDNIGKQVVTYLIASDVKYFVIKQILIQEEMGRVASLQVSDCSNWVQKEPRQILFRPNQELAETNFEDQNTASVRSVNKAQRNQSPKIIVNSAAVEENESQQSNLSDEVI